MHQNLLVLKNYKIADHRSWHRDRSKEQHLAENYQAMEKITIRSARRYLSNLDGIKVFRGKARSMGDAFRLNFYEIYDLWQQGHNVLYADVDVVFMRAACYFSESSVFRMYNLTDPTATNDTFYNMKFPYFFNCGIRYYPKDMKQSVWDLGLSMARRWNSKRWDSEQVIYNAMMWSQGIKLEDVYSPAHAYQWLFEDPCKSREAIEISNERFNRIDWRKCSAIHVHGSRGSQDRLALMEELCGNRFHGDKNDISSINNTTCWG